MTAPVHCSTAIRNGWNVPPRIPVGKLSLRVPFPMFTGLLQVAKKLTARDATPPAFHHLVFRDIDEITNFPVVYIHSPETCVL